MTAPPYRTCWCSRRRSSWGAPNQTLDLTGAGLLVARDTKVLQAAPAAELGRSGATRCRRWKCDTELSPAVLPAVSYRDVRRW